MLQKSGLGEGGQSYLVDTSGDLVQAGSRAGASAEHSVAIDQGLKKIAGHGLYQNAGGIPVVGAYTWIDDMGVALVSEIPQSIAFAPATQLAWTIGLIGIIVVAAVSVSGPMERLGRAPGRLERADLLDRQGLIV